MVNTINENNLWSDLLTKNYLATYTEGLACKNSDKRYMYNTWRNNHNSWWVLRKQPGQVNVYHMI